MLYSRIIASNCKRSRKRCSRREHDRFTSRYLSPTVPSIDFWTIEIGTKHQRKSFSKFVLGGGHGLFGLILAALLPATSYTLNASKFIWQILARRKQSMCLCTSTSFALRHRHRPIKLGLCEGRERRAWRSLRDCCALQKKQTLVWKAFLKLTFTHTLCT